MKFPKMNKKGVFGINLVTGILIGLFVLLLIFLAVMLGADAITDAGLFTTGTANANNTENAIENITAGGSTFFGAVPTIVRILVAVAIISAVVLLVLVVRKRLGGMGGGGEIDL